ncbi:hypothetical protein [Staphylococcus gallinarum]|uniref:Uncharacterized protein n=1 Tax=Staphylococcus gallinarum TaxID=1293 RepID=A0ABQ0XYX9_STAGA|nr:hypothetical protein [Staphylococcus gallinarum]KIR10697.1 hypothetical protein SH09_11060 [Staphylococcus gallinarum]MCD8910391.1 hypothetical protein [Staphylococcus gallinarum]GEQ04592.1 hypothetical protein SGA02_04200 [Staphylococcus gallinarum]
MNKEQAKLRLETNLINYQNKLKFMAKGSMFSRWLSDSILTCEIALKKLQNGENMYEDTPWNEKYTHVKSDKEILEELLSSKRISFRINENEYKALKDEKDRREQEILGDFPSNRPLGELGKERFKKYRAVHEWYVNEIQKLSDESRLYYENYLKQLKDEEQKQSKE